MDCEAQIMYVFGGRVVDGDWDTSKYSGLYSYNVRLSKWRLLQYASFPFPSLVPTHHFPTQTSRQHRRITSGHPLSLRTLHGPRTHLQNTLHIRRTEGRTIPFRYVRIQHHHQHRQRAFLKLYRRRRPRRVFHAKSGDRPRVEGDVCVRIPFFTSPCSSSPALSLHTRKKKVLWSDKRLRLRRTKHHSALIPFKLGLPIRHLPREMGTDHAAPRDDGQ